MHIKLPTLWGDEVLGWQLATQSTQLAQNKAKKNETAAGVALVLAAAVGFTMHVGHQLLGEEDEGQPQLSPQCRIGDRHGHHQC